MGHDAKKASGSAFRSLGIGWADVRHGPHTCGYVARTGMKGGGMGDSEHKVVADSTTKDFIGGFLQRYPPRILESLLQDKTTGRRIVWGGNGYERYGSGYGT